MSKGYKQYRLNVDDAIVEVWQWGDYGHWEYSVKSLNGSCYEQDWLPKEKEAKSRAKEIYNSTGHRSLFTPEEHRLPILKRAKWIQVEHNH
jgi:hypothetical protein